MGGVPSSSSGCGFVATFASGKHIVTATVAELSSAAFSIHPPDESVTGIQDRPSIDLKIDEDACGVTTGISV